jgi:N-acetylmuramoyl-L-alanine amidase
MSDCAPRIGIVVGHHEDAPGASMTIEGTTITEHALWLGFARELARTMRGTGVETPVIHRPNERPDAALGRRINNERLDGAIELHFNAVKDADVSGTLTIHREGHEPSRRLASHLQESTRRVLGLRDRGTFGRGDLGIMRHTVNTLPICLVEPAFGSNPQDAAQLALDQPDLMRAYREAMIAFVDTLE